MTLRAKHMLWALVAQLAYLSDRDFENFDQKPRMYASIHFILHSTLLLLQMHIDELRGESATRRWQNHHSPGKAHAMGSCGTADGAILLKELLGHGLAAHNESDSVLLGTIKISSFEQCFFWLSSPYTLHQGFAKATRRLRGM